MPPRKKKQRAESLVSDSDVIDTLDTNSVSSEQESVHLEGRNDSFQGSDGEDELQGEDEAVDPDDSAIDCDVDTADQDNEDSLGAGIAETDSTFVIKNFEAQYKRNVQSIINSIRKVHKHRPHKVHDCILQKEEYHY